MTSVLVAYASRTASARDAAHVVADVFREAGHEVRLADLKDQPAVDDAGLVVVGSGIQAGSWYPEAVAWVAAHEEQLRRRSAAVFNTCLCVLKPEARAQGLGYNEAMVSRTGATASESFAGRYVPAEVGWWRRLFMRSINKPAQDHFDADAVRAWARTLSAG